MLILLYIYIIKVIIFILWGVLIRYIETQLESFTKTISYSNQRYENMIKMVKNAIQRQILNNTDRQYLNGGV